MTEPLDPSSVLAYLNEMGYYNISTYQLKEFLKDLRKLMKYEDKINLESNINNKINIESNINNRSRLILEKSDQLYMTQTISSKAKTTQKCTEVLRENINKQYSKDAQVKKARDCKTSEEAEKKSHLSENKTSSCLSNIPNNNKIIRECQSLPVKSVTSKKSSIRPTTSAKTTNDRFVTDPVTLYHQYKKEWERKKIPGESSHSGLRWKIRQKICQL